MYGYVYCKLYVHVICNMFSYVSWTNSGSIDECVSKECPAYYEVQFVWFSEFPYVVEILQLENWTFNWCDAISQVQNSFLPVLEICSAFFNWWQKCSINRAFIYTIVQSVWFLVVNGWTLIYSIPPVWSRYSIEMSGSTFTSDWWFYIWSTSRQIALY